MSSGETPACLPAWRGTDKKEIFNYTVKEVKIPSNYCSKREEKQELVFPFGKGCLCGRMLNSCKEEVSHMIKGLVHTLNKKGEKTLFSQFARRK